MKSIKELNTAQKFAPAYFIKEQMEMRGWNIEKMAEILGVSLNELNSIIFDKQSITVRFAEQLAIAFNTSPQYWINLDNDYRMWVEQKNNSIQ
jgi:HTH-type transcriptional regulator/antitoxin HigA